MIIDERYFTNPETYIAGIEIQSDGKTSGKAARIISDIRAYIAKYEPRFLRMLLGKDIADNIEDHPDIVALLAQPDKGTSVIAKYVYFYYSRDHMTFNTVAGEKVKNTENSSRATAGPRLVRVWNDMVGENWQILRSVEDVELSPDIRADIFEPINDFNI